METDKIDIADNFFGLIKNSSVEVKLELINRITDSLRETKEKTSDDSWKELFGAWSRTKVRKKNRRNKSTPVHQPAN